VDTQTRHALKKDKFAQAAATSASWVSGHRAGVVRWTVTIAAALIILAGALIFWNLRSSSAEAALGAAMDVYNAPLAQAGVPAESNTYATAAERAKAANGLFASVAGKYGWLPQGAMARYFTGITDEDLGQTAAAEQELKPVAGSWNRNLANLAKLGLAGIYHQASQDTQAISLYNEIIAKPSATVSANVAELDLADLYSSEGKQDQARALWAKVQDADKEGAAGSIAAQKLNGKQQ
jgi:predicted negative regulator of RcsB-dependent stress response